jgi:hypothetical protein
MRKTKKCPYCSSLRFYHFTALADVILFIVLLTEGILSGLANALSMMVIVMGFLNLLVGIEAEQRANAIKWALWYHKNRELLAEYKQKYGVIDTSEQETHH